MDTALYSWTTAGPVVWGDLDHHRAERHHGAVAGAHGKRLDIGDGQLEREGSAWA